MQTTPLVQCDVCGKYSGGKEYEVRLAEKKLGGGVIAVKSAMKAIANLCSQHVELAMREGYDLRPIQ